ncbi:sedoheptulose 7-phosphate cyclase [Streptomyces sp. SP18CS02]|uniref:sedoheptulose 7-phosphate cyclase n=1 Tax=Streptomyces sp. SP18CS02 TaxID=3002531 RepID=UPI002E7975E0|nr:sedoheptulose 7-phosphate cyclase [Streptomyces sp. SP18CS02]MEE1752142.1 sedoheptulose 7-phosphate cyclase [Streptomyces sp. SP18CS02]
MTAHAAVVEPGVRGDDGGFTLLAPEGTSYRVDIASEVLAPDNPLLAEYCEGRKVVAFLGPTVDRLHGERLRRYLTARLAPGSWDMVVIGGGEEHKTMESVEEICARAKAAGLDRRGVMLAVGGGVTCDLVGFAAAIYCRGVRYIKVNTTLVGQVDVGVGVKTGVNALGTKNMLGSYHPAHASINDPSFLRTLPERQIRCGLGEIAKMAVIKDARLFGALEECPDVFRRPCPDPSWLPTAEHGGRGLEDYVLRTSMELMMEELCPNLREHDLARLVDFGHTFGPVIETASDYRIAHGESVAIDMAISTQLARVLGLIGAEDCERVVRLITALGLPVHDATTCTPELMLQALRAAWERRGRRLHLVVPDGIGSAVFVDDLEDIPAGALAEALGALAARSGGLPGPLAVAH